MKVMENKKASRLLLLVLAATLGSVGFRVPLWGAATPVIFSATQKGYSEILFSSFWGGQYFRPLPLLWSKLSYDSFGLSPVPFQIFSAVVLASFGLAVHSIYLRLAPERPGVALMAAALVLVNTEVWYSFLNRFDGELMAVLFLYLALLSFLRLASERPVRRPYLVLAAIVLFALLAGFTKETARGLFPALLTVFAFVLWRRGSLGRAGVLGYVAGMASIGIPIAIHTLTIAPSVPKPPLEPFRVFGLFVHNLYQLILPVSLLVIVPVIAGLRTRRTVIVAGVAMAVLLLATPPLVLLNYDELLFLSSQLIVSTPLLASSLLMAALMAHFFRGGMTRQLCAGGVLAIFSMVVIAGLFIPTVRSDSSARTFTAAMPLLAWLFVDGLTVLWDRWRKPAGSPPSGRVERQMAGTALVLCTAALLYTAVAADINLATFQTARSNAETAGIRYLSSLDVGNATVYSVDSYPIVSQTVHLYGIPLKGDVRYVPLSTTFPATWGTQYVAFNRFQPRLPTDSPLRSVLHGNFSLFQQPNLDSWQSLWYSATPTPMERSLREKGDLLFTAKYPFVQFARFLDDSVMRGFTGVPWMLEYDWEISIYRLEGGGPPPRFRINSSAF